MTHVFIYDALRSPRAKGRPGGGLSSLLPHQLVAQLVDALRSRLGEDVIDSVESINLSCVGQIGPQGGHLALVSKLEAGLPRTATAQTINNFCVGGLTAIGNSFAAIASGQVSVSIAGGIEMMSHVPFLHDGASYYTDDEVATRLRFAPVGVAADHLAVRHGITRDVLDAVAIESHRRAARAWSEGKYDNQVVAVRDHDGALLLDRDETIKADLEQQDLDSLDPVFASMGADRYDEIVAGPGSEPIEHRHTIAHCPPIADGASLLLLGNADVGARFGLTPLARLDAVFDAGGDEIAQLTAGEFAMTRVLERTGRSLGEMQLIEYMEAFAVVPAMFHANHDIDPDRINPNGGHLAMGHPMGATGAILVTAAAHELNRTGSDLGLVVAHGGSGVGAAAILSRP